MTKKRAVLFLLTIAMPLLLGACHVQALRNGNGEDPSQGGDEQSPARVTAVLDLRRPGSLESTISRLTASRVVFVGETHDRYAHHMTQLRIIQALHRDDPRMAIGMEFFQKPFQAVLDRYVAGELSEAEMLARTEWFDRWRYDYRHYRAIMRFARRHQIPVLALNVPAELTGRVSEVGLSGLSPEERSRLPADYDFSDHAYRERLQEIYQEHAHANEEGFERFVEVQLTWDEGMAETAANYLRTHPDRKLVVLAGSGHLMYGSGIPRRLQRRLPVDARIVLPAEQLSVMPGIADFLVFREPLELPKQGKMGVYMGSHGQGVLVHDVVSGSAADQAGLKKGDVIRRLDDRQVATPADVRIGMLDKMPGDRVELEILRKPLLRAEQTLTLGLRLQPESP